MKKYIFFIFILLKINPLLNNNIVCVYQIIQWKPLVKIKKQPPQVRCLPKGNNKQKNILNFCGFQIPNSDFAYLFLFLFLKSSILEDFIFL